MIQNVTFLVLLNIFENCVTKKYILIIELTFRRKLGDLTLDKNHTLIFSKSYKG